MSLGRHSDVSVASREVQTGWVVEVTDPWGNGVGLTDYKKQPEPGRRR